jgi:hypothetical protein
MDIRNIVVGCWKRLLCYHEISKIYPNYRYVDDTTILKLYGYKSDITINNKYSGIPISWSNL